MWKWLKEKCKNLQCILGSISGNCIQQLREMWGKALFIDYYEKISSYFRFSNIHFHPILRKKKEKKKETEKRKSTESENWGDVRAHITGLLPRSHPPSRLSSLLSSFLPSLCKGLLKKQAEGGWTFFPSRLHKTPTSHQVKLQCCLSCAGIFLFFGNPQNSWSLSQRVIWNNSYLAGVNVPVRQQVLFGGDLRAFAASGSNPMHCLSLLSWLGPAL